MSVQNSISVCAYHSRLELNLGYYIRQKQKSMY